MKKMNTYRLSALMLVLLATLAASGQNSFNKFVDYYPNSQSIELDNVRYVTSSDSTAYVSYQSNIDTPSNVVIRDTVFIDGHPYAVTEIDDYAFDGKRWITTLELPNTLKVIGREAFEDCTNLESVVIPNSVESVGEFAFSRCSKLTHVTLSNSMKEIIWFTFASCSNLETVIIPNSIETIDYGSFYYCFKLAKVNIPNSVKTIRTEAFFSCALDTVRIPASVENIASSAFALNPTICRIIVDPANPVYDSRGDCNAIMHTATNTLVLGCKNTVFPDNTEAIGDEAFYYCHDLPSLDLPPTVKTIGRYAFRECTSLTSVTFPSSLETIRGNAFLSCGNLTTVNFNDGLKYIGDSAFMYCNKITALNLPNSVDYIGSYTFYRCWAVTSIHLPEYLTVIRKYAFNDLYMLEELTLPSTLIEVGDYAFYNNKIGTLVLPEPMVSIGRGAFYNDWLTGPLRIPKNVSYIAPEAFSSNSIESIEVDPENPYYDSRGGCNAAVETATGTLVLGCKNTVIPATVTAIGPYAFRSMGLTSITIPESVSSIGSYAFAGNRNLKKFVFPEAVTTISDHVLYDIYWLDEIDLGSQVTSVGAYAFYDARPKVVYCRSLVPPTWASTPALGTYGFSGTLYVPGPALEAYQADANWSKFANILPIPGEISGDGRVDVDDVILLISMLVDSGAMPSYADLNGDGVADVDDVVLIISMLLGN